MKRVKQTFKVPRGVTRLMVAASAGGSNGYSGGGGGVGGLVTATIPVKPGETLAVLVGGAGTSYGAAGGGGAGLFYGGAGGAGGNLIGGSGASGGGYGKNGGGGGASGSVGGRGAAVRRTSKRTQNTLRCSGVVPPTETALSFCPGSSRRG